MQCSKRRAYSMGLGASTILGGRVVKVDPLCPAAMMSGVARCSSRGDNLRGAASRVEQVGDALSPARAELARIPLGPCPSLHQLRSGSLRFVRRLHSYYGMVRLLVPVHHRLQLLAFPMRTIPLTQR